VQDKGRNRRTLRAVTAAAMLALAVVAGGVVLAGRASAPSAQPTRSYFDDCPSCPTVAPTPTRTARREPTGPTVEAYPNLVTHVTVSPGGTIDVPVTFEGTSSALIDVTSASPGITANFGGVAFEDGTQVAGTSALGMSLSSPSDGSVHISNPGTTPATVGLETLIYTTRYLTTTLSATNVDKNGSVSLDVTLTEATDSDGASAYLQDPAGAQTPITLTKVATGHWTGQVVPTVSGDSMISVQTSGARIRYQYSRIAVRTGNLTLAPGFTESLVDTDQDGLANSLEVTLTVTAKAPASYSLCGHLEDSTGKEIAVDGGVVSLVAGVQQVPIKFDGPTIYASGLSGPYRLVNVTFTDDGYDYSLDVEAGAADMGDTQAYDYHTFQH